MSNAPDALAEQMPVAALPSEEYCLPGAVLRAVREAQGLSTSEVAQVIRFSVRQIEALERDDYAGLPGATLVRGFVRSYAKFLKIDATPLLAALEPAAPVAVADVRPPDNMGEAARPTLAQRVSSRLLAAGLLAIVVVAVVVAGFWYVTRVGDDAPAPAAMIAPPPAPMAPDSVSVPLAAAVAVSSPASGLRVEFDDHSWIEVRDATQHVVFSGEYPAGTRQNIEGKSPFQVWIGKAAGVRVFMGERNIDLQPHTRADVARLTVE